MTICREPVDKVDRLGPREVSSRGLLLREHGRLHQTVIYLYFYTKRDKITLIFEKERNAASRSDGEI